MGHDEGLVILEQSDPLVLLLGLPAIPVALILGKLINWEDTVLNFMRKHVPRIPIIKNVLPFRSESTSQSTSSVENEIPPITNPLSATRTLVGALLMPSIANLFGKIFFSSIKSKFHKTILGGLSFIAIKGCLRMYHKQQQYLRHCQRKILDYTEANISTYTHLNSSQSD